MTPRALLGLAFALLVVPTARADENRGLKLLHEARAAAERGEHERARELIDAARIEWPGSSLIAHELGDALLDEGAWDAALAEYRKGSGPPHAARAAFNSGVARHRRAEAGLAEAGVPADPQALGEVADPGPLIAAIDAATPELKAARRDFLESLSERADERARDSVAALTRRLDELAEMRERLEQQQQDQQDQQQDQQDQQNDEQSDDQDEQDDEQDESDDEQDQQDSDQQPDQPPQDDPQQGDSGDEPPQDDPSEDESDDDPADSDDPGADDEPPPEEPGDPAETNPTQIPQPEQRELTPQQLQQLLDALDQLEAEAQRIEAARRAANRRSVEKDW